MRFQLVVPLLLVIFVLCYLVDHSQGFVCYGISSEDEEVCNGAGACVANNVCSCDIDEVTSPTCARDYFATRGQIIAGQISGGAGSGQGEFGPSQGLNHPRGSVTSRSGEVFIADTENGRILVISESSSDAITCNCNPTHLALSANEAVLYYTCESNALQRIDLASMSQVAIDELSNIRAIAPGINGDTSLYFVTGVGICDGSPVIGIISDQFLIERVCVGDVISNPSDIFTDDDGNIIVVDIDAGFHKYTSSMVPITQLPFVAGESPLKVTRHPYTRKYYISTVSGKIYTSRNLTDFELFLINGGTTEGFGSTSSFTTHGIYFDTYGSRLLLTSITSHQLFSIAFECEKGYGGPGCTVPLCFGVLATNVTVCNSKGACVGPNHCICKEAHRDNSTACAGKEKIVIDMDSLQHVTMSDNFGKAMVVIEGKGYVVCDDIQRIFFYGLDYAQNSMYPLPEPCIAMEIDRKTEEVYVLTSERILLVTLSADGQMVLSPIVGDTANVNFRDDFGTAATISNAIHIQLFNNYLYLASNDRIREINLKSNYRVRTLTTILNIRGFVVDDFGDIIVTTTTTNVMQHFDMQTGILSEYENSKSYVTKMFKRQFQKMFVYVVPGIDTSLGTITSTGYKEIAGSGSSVFNNYKTNSDTYPLRVLSMYYLATTSELIYIEGSADSVDFTRLKEYCPAGYSGNNCEEYSCFGFTSPSDVCSGHGLCTGPNFCTCAPGHYGSDCSSTTSFNLIEKFVPDPGITSVTIGPDGTIYYSRSNKIFEITPQGNTSYIAGTGDTGSVDGVYSSAVITSPSDLKLVNDLLYMSTENRLRVYDLQNREVKTVAGNGVSGFLSGYGVSTKLTSPSAITKSVLNPNVLYIASSSAIFRFDSGSQYTGVVMGSQTPDNYVDDLLATQFLDIVDILVDFESTMIVADKSNVKAVNLLELPHQFKVVYDTPVSALVEFTPLGSVLLFDSENRRIVSWEKATNSFTVLSQYDDLPGGSALTNPSKAIYDKLNKVIVVLDSGSLFAIHVNDTSTPEVSLIEDVSVNPSQLDLSNELEHGESTLIALVSESSAEHVSLESSIHQTSETNSIPTIQSYSTAMSQTLHSSAELSNIDISFVSPEPTEREVSDPFPSEPLVSESSMIQVSHSAIKIESISSRISTSVTSVQSQATDRSTSTSNQFPSLSDRSPSIETDRSTSMSDRFPSLSDQTSSTGSITDPNESSLLHEQSYVGESDTDLSVTILNGAEFYDCNKLDVIAMLDKAISNAQYSWKLTLDSSPDTQPILQTTSSDSTLSFALANQLTGKYSLQLTVSGIWKGATLTAHSSTSFVKPNNKFGDRCQHTIAFASSARIPNDGEISVFNRMGKLFIKTEAMVPGITFSWSIPNQGQRSLRSGFNFTKLVTTSFDSSDFGLDGSMLPAGLPGDQDVFVLLNIGQSSSTVFSRMIQFRTSPSVPLQIPLGGGLRIDSTMSEIKLAKNKLPISGFALTTMFTMTAINWTRRTDEEFTFIFSYLNTKTRKYVPLSTNSDGVVRSTLPLGFGSDSKLEIQLRVLNNWGDYVTSSKELVIVSANVEAEINSIAERTKEILGLAEYEFITGAVTLATFIEQSLNKVRSDITRQQLSATLDSLIEHTSELFTDRAQYNETTVQQRLALVEVLTKSESIVSTEGKHMALGIMNHVLSTTNSTVVSSKTLTLVSDVISNIIAGDFSDESVSKAVLNTTNLLASTMLNQQLISESPTSLTSDNLLITVQVDQASKLSNSIIQTSSSSTGLSSSVVIPSTFDSDSALDSEEIIYYTMIAFSNNPYLYAKPENQQDIATPVLDLTFHYYNGTVVPVANLTQPLTIQISKPKRCDLIGDYATFSCKYWDEMNQEWKSDGCQWINSGPSNSNVTCQCSHTTSFSAFILRKGKCPVRTVGLSITGIIFNTLYIGLCCAILITLFVIRKEQPVTSRYIAPYIGLAAIVVDSLMQGWISNSLAIGLKLSKFYALDTFSYIVMLTANPLSIAALYVFLWQQIRFLLLQNIYHLMGQTGELQKGIMKLGRVIASNLVFLLSTIAVGVTVLMYFLALVIVAATREGERATDRMVAIQATSYAAMLIAVSVGIFVVLFIDLLLAYKRNAIQLNSEDSSNGSLQSGEQVKGIALLVKHMTDNDPLMFRIEAVLILVALLVLLVLYPIGIATVFKNSHPQSGLSVIRFIIEILYMFLKIAAFGGFTCVMTLAFKFRKSRSSSLAPLSDEKSSNDDSSGSGSDSQFIEFLRDKEGSRLMEVFSRHEFSLENLLLFKELEVLRANNLIMSTSERKATLETIDQLYIQNNSERQLNCSNATRSLFKKVVALEEPTLVDTEEVYLKLYNTCVLNLSDTFSRLSATAQYKQFMEAQELKEHLVQSVTI